MRDDVLALSDDTGHKINELLNMLIRDWQRGRLSGNPTYLSLPRPNKALVVSLAIEFFWDERGIIGTAQGFGAKPQ